MLMIGSAAYQLLSCTHIHTVALAGHLGVGTATEDQTETTQSLSEKAHTVYVSRKWLCYTRE